MFNFTLEKYHGTASRHTCPNCNSPREFSRYIDASGNYLAETVGKCNRDSKCGYHYKPKDFFLDNPEFNILKIRPTISSQKQKKVKKHQISNPHQNEQLAVTHNTPSANLSKFVQTFLEEQYIIDSIGNYERNYFVQFLLNLFPDDTKSVERAVESYFIGTFQNKTAFWQIDRRWRIRTGKLILFNRQTGKRITETFINRNGDIVKIKVNWIHAKLKKQGKLNADFHLKQCYFGEHLLAKDTRKLVAIVEAEKTAVIASIRYPEVVWLACGGKQNLKVEDLKRFGDRQIILFPDSDGFAKWKEIERIARTQGMKVEISTLLEDCATEAQKREGYDLADFLIEEQQEIDRYNSLVNRYNSAVDKVLNDPGLMLDFEIILSEQKAILMMDGTISDVEAEKQINDLENLRKIVLSLV